MKSSWWSKQVLQMRQVYSMIGGRSIEGRLLLEAGGKLLYSQAREEQSELAEAMGEAVAAGGEGIGAVEAMRGASSVASIVASSTSSSRFTSTLTLTSSSSSTRTSARPSTGNVFVEVMGAEEDELNACRNLGCDLYLCLINSNFLLNRRKQIWHLCSC